MRSFRLASIPGADNFCIAFIVLAIGIACTVGAAAWQSRHPFIVSYARAEPKDSERVETSLSIHRVPTISYRLDPPVEKTKLRSSAGLPWSCEEVRQATQGLTPRQLERLARLHRLNDEQRAEARRCMKEKRS